jgi:hypothetical protein
VELTGPGAAHVHDDGFGKSILSAHPIRAPEELQKPETELEHCGTVAERSF